MSITGATRLYAIVGDPIGHVRSPAVYTERFAQAGMDAILFPAQVTAATCDCAVPGLMALGNLDGLLVTAPIKTRMAAFATRLGPTAGCIGAVNALRREADGSWTGDMFDGEGFVRGLLDKGARLAGRRVLMFGAGGAGSALACALLNAGVASIRIVSLDPARGEALVHALRQAFAGCDVATSAATRADANGGPRGPIDMVVNASTVGMKPGDGLPGDIGPLAAGTLVGDVVIASEPTAILRLAIAHGCEWSNGHDMHSGQIEAIMAFFAARK